MNYTFDVDVAKKVGVNGAIFLANLQFWILKNKANGTNFHDGRYWTFNSIKAYEDIFPFWTGKQIQIVISKLRDSGLILTGNYNKDKRDRRLWYTLSDEGEAVLNGGNWGSAFAQNVKSDLPEKASTFSQTGKCIYTDINTDIKQQMENSTVGGACAPAPATAPPSSKKKPSRIPTLDEVKAYAIEKGSTELEAEKFFDYWESMGWMRHGSPIVKWKPAFAQWLRNGYGKSNKEKAPAQTIDEIAAENEKRREAEFEAYWADLQRRQKELNEEFAKEERERQERERRSEAAGEMKEAVDRWRDELRTRWGD